MVQILLVGHSLLNPGLGDRHKSGNNKEKMRENK
jgi:hypothetical protein